MIAELSPLLLGGLVWAYLGAVVFLGIGIYLSYQRRRLHPVLLLSISAVSFSWIEAPYDWAMYAQFPPELPRMPSWWPLNMTWGGLPSSVPLGYIAYFALPAVIGSYLGTRLSKRFDWRRPIALLTTGLIVGFVWALVFNGGFGARLGVFYYGRVISGLALFEGTKHQYPLYDALAMGIQAMVFSYLIGRTDPQGRTIIDMWADSKTTTKVRSALLSILAFIVAGNVVYASVFLPHLITKKMGLVDAGPTEQLFEGVENQPE